MGKKGETNDSFLLRNSIMSLREYIKMQYEIIRETRKKIVLQTNPTPQMSFYSETIANFEPIDPRIQREYLSKRMSNIAKKLKAIKIERQKTRKEIAEAVETMKKENISLQEQIEMLSKY